MDELYCRNRCGWVHKCRDEDCESDHENNGYICNFPPDDDCATDQYSGKRLCHTFQCPIAYEADREDIRRKDKWLWENDYKPYPNEQPTDWMVLYVRPRYAYVPNVVVLGCQEGVR